MNYRYNKETILETVKEAFEMWTGYNEDGEPIHGLPGQFRIYIFFIYKSRLSIDHIAPWSLGGKTEFYNLQTLCRKCNSSKHNN